MTRRPNASKTDLNRVLDVLDRRGESWGAIKVSPGGEVLVMRSEPACAEPSAGLERERRQWLDSLGD